MVFPNFSLHWATRRHAVLYWLLTAYNGKEFFAKDHYCYLFNRTDHAERLRTLAWVHAATSCLIQSLHGTKPSVVKAMLLLHSIA